MTTPEIRDAVARAHDSAAEVTRLRQGLSDLIGVADSFCDCDGDEVASQIKIRVRALLGIQEPSA